ncbi:AbiJ-NTD4 domain-containing protein [Methylosinus sp. Sm6]|uniref:AbiJ-NTD4 domain-containing protein n=1 Tax=Methylosinus sp. Sm6 TaxID=2866948 RepID=UPI001C99D3D5|nr:hypothetical protein [Methylosinus sp. Sm6]
MPSFSERHGFKKPKQIQITSLDAETRHSLWNVCAQFIFINRYTFLNDDTRLQRFARDLYAGFYKLPINDIPSTTSTYIANELKFFQNAEWFDVFDMIEFICCQLEEEYKADFINVVNFVLEREKSAFRFVGGALAPLSSETDVDEIELAINQNDKFKPVSAHIAAALSLFATKPTADYRNSIKESISAVESAARLITQSPTATLGDAIKKIDAKHSLHNAFKDGILKIYGYTNDKGGIRHSLTEETNVDEADARFMLVFCSAFANYLISRFDEVVD